MRIGKLGILAALSLLTGVATAATLERLRSEYAERRFGIFIHWGLYSAYAQGEWYLEEAGLDEADYARMQYGFCPSKFDARAWARAFKAAGAKYVTITARHHDGFSLWPTQVDDGYNIANTPFGRDILGELAAACRAEGLEFNLYYSLMDWHRRDYPTGRERQARSRLAGRHEDYASYQQFMLRQLEELLSRYRPGCIWFDGEWDHDPENEHSKGRECPPLDWGFDEIYALVHGHGALVANNNHRLPRPGEDIQLFERDLPGENATGLSGGQAVDASRPLEQCDVIQKGVWGYRIKGAEFRTAPEVVAMLARSAAKGSNLLLNIGPNGAGELPPPALAVLAGVGEWLKVNGESIYATVAGPQLANPKVVATRRGETIYLHFLDGEAGEVELPFPGKAAVSCLDQGAAASCELKEGGRLCVRLKRPAPGGFDTVVRVAAKEGR